MAGGGGGAREEEEEEEEEERPLPLGGLLTSVLSEVAEGGRSGVPQRPASPAELEALRKFFPGVVEAVFDAAPWEIPRPTHPGAQWRWLACRGAAAGPFTWLEPEALGAAEDPVLGDDTKQLVTFFAEDRPAWLGDPEELGALLQQAGKEVGDLEYEPANPEEAE